MTLEDLLKPYIQELNLARYKDGLNPSFLPILLTGGVGDIITQIDSIRVLSKKFKIAVYTKHLEVFKYFYREEILAFREMPDYLWYLEMDSFCKFIFKEGFYGFLKKEHEELYLQQQQHFKKHPKLEFLIQDPQRRYFLISIFAKEIKKTKHSFPLFSLGFNEPLDYEVFSKQSENYITIHDGYDATQNISGRSTKQWKWSHWNLLVKKFKKLHPTLKVIQLGSLTSREIDGVDECLINQTSILEALEILSRSKLHIDGDSGLTHGATRLSIPCVVLWGPTPSSFYGYPQNTNLTSSVCSQACYGFKPNWNDKCALNYSTPKCMDEILPDQVMEAINYEL